MFHGERVNTQSMQRANGCGQVDRVIWSDLPGDLSGHDSSTVVDHTNQLGDESANCAGGERTACTYSGKDPSTGVGSGDGS